MAKKTHPKKTAPKNRTERYPSTLGVKGINDLCNRLLRASRELKGETLQKHDIRIAAMLLDAMLKQGLIKKPILLAG
jgi:hypothetical protein